MNGSEKVEGVTKTDKSLVSLITRFQRLHCETRIDHSNHSMNDKGLEMYKMLMNNETKQRRKRVTKVTA